VNNLYNTINKKRGMEVMKFKVKVNTANNVSKSLRITLPVKIAEILKVKKENSVEYVVSAENDELTISLRKSE